MTFVLAASAVTLGAQAATGQPPAQNSRPELPHVQLTAGRSTVTVTDNGIGFRQDYADQIFRMFERLNGRTAYPGSGIGLAICRKIVERHRGTIEAGSTPGHGATFTVILPVTHNKPGIEK